MMHQGLGFKARNLRRIAALTIGKEATSSKSGLASTLLSRRAERSSMRRGCRDGLTGNGTAGEAMMVSART